MRYGCCVLTAADVSVSGAAGTCCDSAVAAAVVCC